MRLVYATAASYGESVGLFGTSFPDVLRAVEHWEPGLLTSELQYRDSLAAHLQSSFAHASLEKEHGLGRARVDIYLQFAGPLRRMWDRSNSCFFELKKDIASNSSVQRLLGQMRMYKEAGALPLIIIACGQIDHSALAPIRSYARELNNELDYLYASDAVVVREKG